MRDEKHTRLIIEVNYSNEHLLLRVLSNTSKLTAEELLLALYFAQLSVKFLGLFKKGSVASAQYDLDDLDSDLDEEEKLILKKIQEEPYVSTHGLAREVKKIGSRRKVNRICLQLAKRGLIEDAMKVVRRNSPRKRLPRAWILTEKGKSLIDKVMANND